VQELSFLFIKRPGEQPPLFGVLDEYGVLPGKMQN
jgi:hypothetical protein